MKVLVVVAGLIALCACKSVPLVPGDNSHYVEGESQYIWMLGSEGTPVLVDLEGPVDNNLLNSRNGDNNEYWLFTRSNPTSPNVIVHGDADSIRNSGFIASRPLKVIVHGWNNNGNTELNPLITSAFLDVQDANVIVVDWRALANSWYNTAVAGVPGVGQSLGNFLIWLIDTTGGKWSEVHLVGFSLGAHIVAVAGRTAGGRPARVTGLDPAGPLWNSNENAMSPDAGEYVEAIHTDGKLLGIHNPVGHADFYPNGGTNPQPGCTISTCSHGRATELFASSVRFDHFIGRQCPNIWEAQLSTCSGETSSMGNAVISKRGSGLFALRTGNTWPY